MQKELLNAQTDQGLVGGVSLERLKPWLAAIAAIFVPLLVLVPIHGTFYTDWFNHIWAAMYYGEYFKSHAAMPTVMNTMWSVGMTRPVFYGYLLYPLLAPFTMVFGGELGMRIAVLVIMVIQYACVLKSLQDFKAPPNVAYAIACLVNWSTYALTNLYNRNAMTEFFAVAFLTSAIAILFSITVEEDRLKRRFLCYLAGIFGALSAGSHPITAFLGVPFVLTVLIYTFLLNPRDRWLKMLYSLLPSIVLSVIVLAPWVYALHLFQSSIFITDGISKIIHFPDDIDSFIGRWSPVPYDLRATRLELKDISTPYLDAQINDALLFLALWLGGALFLKLKNRKPLIWVFGFPFLLFVVYLIFSQIPSAYEVLPVVFKSVQYAYRLVSYINLAILIVFYGIFVKLREFPDGMSVFEESRFKKVLIGVMALASVALAVKLSHARAIMDPNEAVQTDVTVIPKTMYSWQDYSTPAYLALLGYDPPRADFAIGQGSELGDPNPLVLDLKEPSWIGTNVLVFPWNRIFIDNFPIPPNMMTAWDAHWRNVHTAVYVPAGHHVLTYHFDPDPRWLFLHRLSAMVLLAWGFALLVFWSETRAKQGSRIA